MSRRRAAVRAVARLVAAGLVAALAGGAGAQDGRPLEERFNAGYEAFRQGKVNEALELLESVAAESPDYREVQLLLGQVKLAAGLERQAKQHFERVTAKEPGNGHAHFLLGFSLYRATRYVEAVAALDRAQELAGRNPYPLTYRGLAYLRLGRLAEARKDVDAAVAIAPGDSTVLAAAAELELAEGRWQSAEERLRQLPAAEQLRSENRLLLGRILFESGRPAEAVPIFQQVIERLPERSDILYLLAQAQLRSGDSAAGRATLEQFRQQQAREEEIRLLEAEVSTGPDDVDARLRLLRLLIDNRQKSDALLHLAALRRRLPGDPRVSQLATEIDRLPLPTP